MRPEFRPIVLPLVAFVAATTLLPPLPAAAEELNSIVLRVNDEIATTFDYRQRRDARLAAISELDSISTDQRKEYVGEAPRATMREMLDELLLLSRARQLVIEPSRGEIDEMIDATRQRMGIPDDAAFENALRSSNMTIDDYRDRTTRSIKANQVIQREVNPKIDVEDEWAQRYYREHAEEFRVPARVKVRELVIPTEKASVSVARARAEEVRVALAGGEGMPEVAARLGSELVLGPVDLGWVEPGQLAPALDSAVWALSPGALSDPVEARGGLHLLEVTERIESSIRPYAEVKAGIADNERERRHDEVLKKYLGDLEKAAFIVENIPPEAAGFREVESSDENDPLAAFAPKREAARQAPPLMEPIAASDETPAPTPPR